MRIAIDARPAAEVPAGRGRHVRELLRHLARLGDSHDYLLLAREPWECPDLGARFAWHAVRGRDPLWALPAARAATRDADVLLATTSYLLAGLARVPTAAIVYDLVSFAPETRPPRGSLAERLTLPLAARRSSALICISEATRAELVERFPAASARAHTVPLGVGAEFALAGRPGVAARYGIERPYVLITGTLEPRKNLPRAIEAFATMPEELRDRHELVLAGGRGWATAQTDAALARHRQLVRVLGHVPDADLPALYAEAEVFLYPSLREGFGLPVVEAMAAGTAVVTSGVSSLPEVGGDAASYADPLDVNSIRTALCELLGDGALRAELARRGRQRAAAYTWERTARETLAVMESIAT